jgi:hypothetical protein
MGILVCEVIINLSFLMDSGIYGNYINCTLKTKKAACAASCRQEKEQGSAV